MMPDSLFISNFDFEVTFGNKNLDSRDSDLSTGGAKNEDTRLILPCKELKTRGRRQNDPVDAIEKVKEWVKKSKFRQILAFW